MLSNWRIRTRLGLLVVIPGLVLTLVAGLTIADRVSVAHDARETADRVEALTLASTTSGAFVGLSALDVALTAAREILPDKLRIAVEGTRPTALEGVRSSHAQLLAVRPRFDGALGAAFDRAATQVEIGLSADGPDRDVRYTEAVAALDELIGELGNGLDTSTDDRVSAVIELSDLFRAEMTWAFVGMLGPHVTDVEGTDRDTMLDARTRIDVTLAALGDTLPPADHDRLMAALDAPDQQMLLQEIERNTSDWDAAGGLDPVTAIGLIAAAQQRLTAVADIQDDVRAALLAEASKRADDATRDLWLIAGFLVLFFTGSLLSVLAVSRSLTRPLDRLLEMARRLAAGDTEASDDTLDGQRNEIGVLWGAFTDLTAMLRTVAEQTSALATGEAPPTCDLPGPIGASLSSGLAGAARARAALEFSMGKLRDSEEIAHAVVNSAADAIWTIDADGIVRSANLASGRMLGYRVEDMLGRSYDTFLRSSGLRDIAASQTIASAEVVLVGRDDRPVHALVSASRVSLSNGEDLYVLIGHDIDERKEFEAELERLAVSDPLTGVLNRTGVNQHLEWRCAQSEAPFALLFLDLDRFKQVNDTFGHQIGDEVLKTLIGRLCGAVRDQDVVGRLAGDEFVIVVEDQSTEDVLRTAARLIEVVSAPCQIGEVEVVVGASVGVAVHERGTTSPGGLLQHAALAMYEAKQRGRGRVELFNSALAEGASRRADVEQALRAGLTRGELVAHFQPVVDLDLDATITSAELLVRWNRPDHGLVPPMEFIPVAEECGLVVDIARWGLDVACETIVRWGERYPGRNLRVAVNISGVHIARGGLIDDVTAALGRWGAPAELLTVELTETALVADLDMALGQLLQLRALGVGIAIDDFGTGYSSLTYLQQLPIDTVKIDRSFVERLHHSDEDNDAAIVRMVTGLARMMDLKTIAEGIEREDQRAMLTDLGCDSGQGYLFSRPVSRDDLEQLLDSAGAGAGSSRLAAFLAA